MEIQAVDVEEIKLESADDNISESQFEVEEGVHCVI